MGRILIVLFALITMGTAAHAQYAQINQQNVAQALRSNLSIYTNAPNPLMETPTAPIPYMSAGKGVLLGSGHSQADVQQVTDANGRSGTFTIELRKTGATGKDRKFLVRTYAKDPNFRQGSIEYKTEIERCIHLATGNNWEVRFEP
jgi:hypothetical protein